MRIRTGGLIYYQQMVVLKENQPIQVSIHVAEMLSNFDGPKARAILRRSKPNFVAYATKFGRFGNGWIRAIEPSGSGTQFDWFGATWPACDFCCGRRQVIHSMNPQG